MFGVLGVGFQNKFRDEEGLKGFREGSRGFERVFRAGFRGYDRI